MQISQAKAILFQHQSEWSRILGEENERQSYIQYGIMLTIIAHIATFIGNAFLASALSMGFGFGFGMSYWLTFEIIQVVLAIATLYSVPQILAALAPSFGGQNSSL